MENSELLIQLQAKNSSEKGRVGQAMKDLEEAENEIEELEKSLSHLTQEKKQFEKTITQFALESQRLNKEREEHLHFLEEARTSLATFRKREEEYPFLFSLLALLSLPVLLFPLT